MSWVRFPCVILIAATIGSLGVAQVAEARVPNTKAAAFETWVAQAGNAQSAGVGTSNLSFDLEWSTGALPDAGGPIAESSPNVATLDPKGPAVVVGDRDGYLYAFHLADGTPVPHWPALVASPPGSVPIDSSPSVVASSPGSPIDDVLVGSGNAAMPAAGGYQAIGPGGNRLWFTSVQNPATDPSPAYAVQASMAVANFGRTTAAVAGSLGQQEYALFVVDGSVVPGWPFFTSDSVFSTAALADLYGNGSTEIVEGSDQTAGYALGQTYLQGGHLRILSANGGLICDAHSDQTVDSSPAVGDFLAGGQTGIAVGTGVYFPEASDTDSVIAFTTQCQRAWTTRLDGSTVSSPALGDVSGDGNLDVVEGTATSSGGGSLWVLDGATGHVEWEAPTTAPVIGSVTTADLTGAGYEDILVPTVMGVDIFDGRTHELIAVLNGPGDPNGVLGFQNAPLVTDDPGGGIGITLAGYGCPGKLCFGQIEHYEVRWAGTGATGSGGPSGSVAVGPGSWPQFHHDPQLTGNAGDPPNPRFAPCMVPAGALDGYDLAGSDGGVFAFGTPFCGSEGGLSLAAPVVGIAQAPSSGGYWLVGADGGVFAFGGARFFGSMGGKSLNAPIVGMAATSDGYGYWLVGSDGGVFAFGDAGFFGSMGGKSLDAPVVGMVANPDDLGYWLVGSDGGVFAFGDATFMGSTGGEHLSAPVVGIAHDPSSGGYWLVGADGGVFAFGNARFLGSMGGNPLDAAVVGIAGS